MQVDILQEEFRVKLNLEKIHSNLKDAKNGLGHRTSTIVTIQDV